MEIVIVRISSNLTAVEYSELWFAVYPDKTKSLDH